MTGMPQSKDMTRTRFRLSRNQKLYVIGFYVALITVVVVIANTIHY